MLRNTEKTYGWVAIALHWLTALGVFGLFPLGLYMTDLTYYDPLYKTLPYIHKSIGVVLFIVILLRIAWRIANPCPWPLPTHAPWERALAKLTHALIYWLLVLVPIAGYLISTADGRPVEVFGLFAVPATITAIPEQEDVAGIVHLGLAIALLALVGLHIAGAIKHHLIDRDTTLLRMLRPRTSTQP